MNIRDSEPVLPNLEILTESSPAAWQWSFISLFLIALSDSFSSILRPFLSIGLAQ